MTAALTAINESPSLDRNTNTVQASLGVALFHVLLKFTKVTFVNGVTFRFLVFSCGNVNVLIFLGTFILLRMYVNTPFSYCSHIYKCL